MADIGYQATLSAVVINNTAGAIATTWQQVADLTASWHTSMTALGHDGLVSKGVPDDGHNPADPLACAPGRLLYTADVMSTAADIWAGRAAQPSPFSFSDATKALRFPRPGG